MAGNNNLLSLIGEAVWNRVSGEHAKKMKTAGYTDSPMTLNAGPMGNPVQDPRQFSGPYWQTPYGGGSFIQNHDIEYPANMLSGFNNFTPENMANQMAIRSMAFRGGPYSGNSAGQAEGDRYFLARGLAEQDAGYDNPAFVPPYARPSWLQENVPQSGRGNFVSPPGYNRDDARSILIDAARMEAERAAAKAGVRY